METKHCLQCSIDKSLDKFYFNARYKKYKSWCIECTKIQAKKFYINNRAKKLEYARSYRKKYPEKIRNDLISWRLKLRLEVLKHYSQDNPVCDCCGEQEIEFLGVDHIEGGGYKHLKEINKRGSGFYSWLKINHYPTGFQILCHNCNMAKGFYGQCPHKK